MAPPARRPRATSPSRERLAEVRRALLRLHKALIDAERRSFEARNGPLSNGRFLQLLIQDPSFEWLGPYTALIVAMDEALAGEEPAGPETLRDYLERTHALVAPEPASDANERLERARAADAAVRAAHAELTRQMAAADGG